VQQPVPRGVWAGRESEIVREVDREVERKRERERVRKREKTDDSPKKISMLNTIFLHDFSKDISY
jgi:hypothetical protein